MMQNESKNQEKTGEKKARKNRMRERKVWQGKNKKGEQEEEDTSYLSNSKAGASWAQE